DVDLRILPPVPTRRSSDLDRVVEERTATEGWCAVGTYDGKERNRHLVQVGVEDRRPDHRGQPRAEDHEPQRAGGRHPADGKASEDRKSTRLNSSHVKISYA